MDWCCLKQYFESDCSTVCEIVSAANLDSKFWTSGLVQDCFISDALPSRPQVSRCLIRLLHLQPLKVLKELANSKLIEKTCSVITSETIDLLFEYLR
jgi:hypothetical protein